MAKFIPVINCGYLAGESPEAWPGVIFESEDECREWIDGHMDEFSEVEVGGSIYPQEIY